MQWHDLDLLKMIMYFELFSWFVHSKVSGTHQPYLCCHCYQKGTVLRMVNLITLITSILTCESSRHAFGHVVTNRTRLGMPFDKH